jgi:lysophospholipase L1-like esterase
MEHAQATGAPVEHGASVDESPAAGVPERATGPPWRRFAVVGDSIAEAQLADRVPGVEPVPWPARVARALRARDGPVETLNLGERRLPAFQVRRRQLDAAIAFAPDLTAVACGGNDVLGTRFDPAATARELRLIVRALRSAGSAVLLLTVFDIVSVLDVPEPFGSRLRERAPVLYRRTAELAAEEGAWLVDLRARTAEAGPEIFSADGIHANHLGHVLIAEEILAVLDRHGLRRST